MAKQLTLFSEEDFEINQKDASSGTFQDNMKLPLHRWYRYTAGFSANWVASVIKEEKQNGRTHVIDPFTGSGTVLIESTFEGIDSMGVEANDYVYRIAKTKLNWADCDVKTLKTITTELVKKAKALHIDRENFPSLILKCYPLEIARKLESLKICYFEMEEGLYKDYVWFVLTSILRSTSPVGTAQWQYIQPNKTKSKVLDPYVAFENKISEMINDILTIDRPKTELGHANLFKEDARTLSSIPDGWGDLVITSPPYANNYDYADAMRLEMTFWEDIQGWNDLQEKVSVHLIRACTQHVSGLKNDIEEYLQSDLLAPIIDELIPIYERMRAERENHGGKKNYHMMITAYFYDMAQVFKALARATNDNCKMCFVIGDSAPYGVYVPVDRWLGILAQAVGFRDYWFEKLRDRNTKWKNRKHDVLLKEGRLWITK